MEEHPHGSQEDHQGCEWHLADGMLQVDAGGSNRQYSGGVELVDIALDVAFLFLVSHYVRARVPVVLVAVSLLVMHVACYAPRCRALDRSPPEGRETGNS